MDLLIEIGTEELPARVIPLAVEYLRERFSVLLKRDDLITYATPRRLAFYLKDFKNEGEEREELIVGPPLSVAYQDGKPTKALLAFLDRVKAREEDLIHLQKDRGTYVAVRRIVKEESPLELLSKSFEEILLSVPFPKSMRWDSSGVRFSRPVRWICALWGDQIVPLTFGNIKADRKTKGHRFLSSGWIELGSAEEYLQKLTDAYVIPQFNERLGLILSMLKEEAYRLGGVPEYPEGLQEEVANLVEFPFVVVGSFEDKYLELPEKVIITVLAHHQRFFCVRSQEEDRLLPFFLAVSNNAPKNGEIVEGYRKVVKARLEDALFFYKEDLKRPLDQLVEQLSGVVFHPRAGSMWDKTIRVMELSQKIAGTLNLEEGIKEKIKRAAYLSKADLLTHMVREMDELQGYMGYVYAKAQGEDEEVARALYEQYLPARAHDPVPLSPVSYVLSLADKLDTIKTLLEAGEVPTGSSDPYGLKRAAFGVLAIIDAHQLDLHIDDLVEVSPKLEEFLRNRLEAYLEPYGQDVVRAVLSVHSPLRPLEVIKLVRSIANIREEERFKDVVEVYRRVVRILPKGWLEDKVKETLLREEAEKRLYEKLLQLEESPSLSDLWKIKPVVDEFFDSVLVMDKDEAIRTNRLALLMRVRKLMERFANFDLIT
ncbi:glycyl-tRNA synthetase, beta subunit [Thermocrinis albus DSM 14484]|uniref:Glycine--tRNA ligase beta subunit n=1 Tax=Thermocrinis albus (strain DSM 14484 / JCM 11386 / HI 11/12) TaxID=638303 RepID=D3SNF1_THEAH|nr:glycine--tRNA ligase subunit beta [Thermocrinis albus]ADC88688.1 glycyl-tRNA synthetase, beta subunit [Thermocrinis albus DSM 14484]